MWPIEIGEKDIGGGGVERGGWECFWNSQLLNPVSAGKENCWVDLIDGLMNDGHTGCVVVM